MDKSILINDDNKLKNSLLERLSFIMVKDIQENEIRIEEETYNNYLQLKEYLKSKGIVIDVLKKYVDDTSKTDEEFTAGLAINFTIRQDNNFINNIKDVYNNEELYKEVHNHLSNFGFILRHPKDKEEVTGKAYCPWHIRYVGNFIAKTMEDNNQTLEEYKNSYSGIIVVNKEKGMTSFDVVKRISDLYGIKKVGHTGTLDPMAEGALIVCVGKATKIVELLTAYDKAYVAGVKLGIKTDTYDILGKTLLTQTVTHPDNLEEVLNSFQKTYMQKVPIYSAVKVNGKKLYEYARKNEIIDTPRKEVTIKSIKLLEEGFDYFVFRAEVSKGCYIRSLINDIGKALGIYATMTSLVRTKQGKVTLNESFTLAEIEKNLHTVLSVEDVLPYPVYKLDKETAIKVKNGVALNNDWNIEDKVIFKYENTILGIYEKDNDKLKVWKNF